MSSKIVVLISGRPKGNTYKIIKMIENEMNNIAESSFEYISLNNSCNFCNNCYQCFNKGEDLCPHKDFIQPIIEKIDNADGIILSSPLYSESITASLKNFLDHTSYLYHRPKFFNKKGLAITTVTGVMSQSSSKYLQKILERWGIFKPMRAHFPLWDIQLDMKKISRKKIRQISKKFSKLLTKKEIEKPSFMRLIWFNIWRQVIKADTTTFDYKYWQKSRWFTNSFYFENRVNLHKKIISKSLNLITEKMF